jgi:hypothetical protein
VSCNTRIQGLISREWSRVAIRMGFVCSWRKVVLCGTARHPPTTMSDEPSNGAPVFKRPIKSRPTRTRDGSPTSTPTNVASDKSETEGSPMTLAAKLKAKQKSRSKLQSRVSFGGDEEEEDGGEVFKVKKSSLSLKVRHSSSQYVFKWFMNLFRFSVTYISSN